MTRRRQSFTGLGLRLSLIRKDRQLTQVELAEAVGVTQAMISFYEKGVTEPSASVLVALARELGVSTDELLGLSKPAKKEPGHNRQNIRLLRKLRQAEKLPTKERRAVVQFIDALIERQQLRGAQ
jgi:transcriptional regulator with XRE-family HTH domain